eukprot:TRINITY_DN3971_c2_g2_i1.p1 TRINITY_DN3971_c2_g2~~TRINITY_DN3971_c2_g2_i1.p1  ORF type:complete len:307 (-),score=69.26 TRINITY_DN3971_c2_g2_i1:723-1643(-)
MATGGNHHHTSSPSSGLKGPSYDNYWEKDSDEDSAGTLDRNSLGGAEDDGSLDKSEDCPNYYDVYDSGRAPNISDLKYGPSRPHQVVLSPAWGSVPALSTEPLHEAGGKKGGGCCSENGGRVAIGMFGIAMGVLGLVAYLVIQAPSLRHQIGWLHLSNPPSETLFSYNATKGKIFSPDELVYGTELALTVIVCILGIIANSLLVYGVSNNSSSFLLPWLIFNVLFIVSLYVAAAIVFVLAHPLIYKLWGLIPAVVGFIYIYFWVKVWELYRKWRNQMKQNMALVEQMNANSKQYMYSTHTGAGNSW